MWYSIIIITLITLFYFKKKSKSQFFKQDDYALEMFREKMVILLQIKDRTPAEISNYCAAYDFFCKFTTKFDGATFVKDLCDLPKLDLDAMVHDYECLIGANRNYDKWYYEAWQYYENMRKQGKGNRPGRLIGLSIIGLFFVPYCYLFTKKYNKI